MDLPRTGPAFVAVDWAAEYLDGLVIVALLQSEGIDAFLHNENFVRQDWFYVLAYGGFRVLVTARDADGAIALLSAYRAGDLAVDDAIVDHPSCPGCTNGCGESDPSPRRQVFAAFLLVEATAFALMFFNPTLPMLVGTIVVLLALPDLAALAPCVLRWHVLRRYRCRECAVRWRAPALPRFGQLQHDAQT